MILRWSFFAPLGFFFLALHFYPVPLRWKTIWTFNVHPPPLTVD